jgi:hypothetical protein
VQAAKVTNTTIPIVFNSGVDPVTAGIVASLSRPGGNVTGVSSITSELAAKRFELLLELMPKARVVALFTDPGNPGGEREVTEVAARALGLKIRKLRPRNERDLDAAFASLKTSPVDALIVGNDGYFARRRQQITESAARQGLPAIYPRREFVASRRSHKLLEQPRRCVSSCGNLRGHDSQGHKSPADRPVGSRLSSSPLSTSRRRKPLGTPSRSSYCCASRKCDRKFGVKNLGQIAGQEVKPDPRQGPKLRGDRSQRSGVCSAPEPTDPPMAAALRMQSRRSSRTQRGTDKAAKSLSLRIFS